MFVFKYQLNFSVNQGGNDLIATLFWLKRTDDIIRVVINPFDINGEKTGST